MRGIKVPNITGKLKVGDEVIRWLAGEIPHRLKVTKISKGIVSCGDWTFDERTGAEIDDDLGWGPPPKMTGSYIVPVREIN
jgi:hypothetical protein